MPGAGPIKWESLRVGCGHWERREALRVLMCRWSGELLPYTICPITSLSSSPTTSPFSLYSLHANWTGLFTVLEYTRNAPASGPLHRWSPPAWNFFPQTSEWLGCLISLKSCPDLKICPSHEISSLFRGTIPISLPACFVLFPALCFFL